MFWQNGELKSPFSGKLLTRDSAHSLSDGETRFPVIAEIPFLRANRDELKSEVLRLLDLEDKQSALVLLLQDQDDWAKTAPPTTQDLQPLFDNQNLTLRDAMQCLKYGAVADYFAHRWSDPTFLSGLALLEWHLPNNAKTVFELCCGIGHYLREFGLRNIEAIGADVVFSKLWLARKFVAPEAKLICVDANFDLPFADKTFAAAFCHDAFYFLPEKQLVANELTRITNGAILIGHAHNSDADNFSSGAAISVEEYARIVRTGSDSDRVNVQISPVAIAPGSDLILYDDAELTNSIIGSRHPQAQSAENLIQAAAIAVVKETQTSPLENEIINFALPIAGRRLQLNPLLEGENQQILPAPRFPSERYANEYAELSDYLNLNGETISVSEQAKMFYGGWASDRKLINFVRRRIFVDLPDNW